MSEHFIRKASYKDIEAVEKIYDKVHDAEENNGQVTGWIRGVYPVRRTAEEAISRGDLYEWNNDNLTCFKDMVELSEDLLVLVENVMERFGRGYSSSRYDDAYKNLITLSEIILIGYNSNDKGAAIKEKFANRLATAIAQDVDVQTVHDKALRMYKERSNETHEGNNLNITKEELRELRCAVRKMVQNFIFFAKNQYGSIVDKTFKGIKREYVIGLLVRIHILQTRGLLR